MKRISSQCAAITTAMTVIMCKQDGIKLAGTPIVAPRHYHLRRGRTDETLWVEAMDKEVTTLKCFTIGTWQTLQIYRMTTRM